MLLKQMVSEMPVSPGQVISKEHVLNWFATRYPKIKEGTIAAHLIRFSTNAPSRLHYNAKPGEEDIFFQVDGSHFRLFNPATDPAPIEGGKKPLPGTVVPQPQPDDESDPDTAAFAYESDLRNFLSKNLHVIQPGLRLFDDEGITGVEFPAGGRFIDILAQDGKGGYVVIELKVSRGYDRALGQLRRYMGWIKKNQAEPTQAVRGLIVAREITEDLVLACSGLPDVELFEYEMSVSVKKVAR